MGVGGAVGSPAPSMLGRIPDTEEEEGASGLAEDEEFAAEEHAHRYARAKPEFWKSEPRREASESIVPKNNVLMVPEGISYKGRTCTGRSMDSEIVWKRCIVVASRTSSDAWKAGLCMGLEWSTQNQ